MPVVPIKRAERTGAKRQVTGGRSGRGKPGKDPPAEGRVPGHGRDRRSLRQQGRGRAGVAGQISAELAGTVQLWEWIGDDGATTFSY